jgi:hypothetical protein
MVNTILILVVVSLMMIYAGICSGWMDLIQFHWDLAPDWMKAKPEWFNPSISWRNKWKNGDFMQGEKFKWSSTFLVWLTDGWHNFKFRIEVCIFVSFGIIPFLQLPSPWMYLLLPIWFRICFGVGFWKGYKTYDL